MNPRALKVEYIDNYQLLVTFTNGEVKQFDLVDYLKYPVYKALQDDRFCKQVKVTDGIVTWDADTDIDPDLLYLESKHIDIVAAN